MKKGYLSDYFVGIAAKKRSRVESSPDSSNQHEFNGVAQLKKLFGSDKQNVDAKFFYLSDEEDQRMVTDGFLTWYDARENHPERSEFRLYFPSNSVTDLSKPNDLLIIAKSQHDSYAVIIAPSLSTYESQLIWLFGIASELQGFDARVFDDKQNEKISYASKFILEELGIIVEEADENFLDLIFETFGNKFPTTKLFSEFARNTLPEITSTDDPDRALMAWIEREELLFKTLEEYQVLKELEKGFDDVDSFISYSLSVHNRRKSRVGFALENHLVKIFNDFKLKYSHGSYTENRSSPDFLFPDINKYLDAGFPPSCLTMLGVKTTCKDRWRQVLSEAKRIETKHLFTLEPGISENQTNEMKSNSLFLVLPKELHVSFKIKQQKELFTLHDFIEVVKNKQLKCL